VRRHIAYPFGIPLRLADGNCKNWLTNIRDINTGNARKFSIDRTLNPATIMRSGVFYFIFVTFLFKKRIIIYKPINNKTMKKQLYRTVILIEVLSEEPIPEHSSLDDIVGECNDGEFSCIVNTLICNKPI
jgi:hypothetical protein